MFIFCCLNTILFSQSTFSALLSKTSIKTSSLTYSEDSNVVTLIQKTNQITISRFTADGILKASKTLNIDDSITVARIAMSANGSYIIAGFNLLHSYIF